MKIKIIRSMVAFGRNCYPGEVIDVDDSREARVMMAHGWIAEASPNEPQDKPKSRRGRPKNGVQKSV